jgi:FkbM family methyltransferase
VRRVLRRFDFDLVRTHTTIEGHLPRLLKSLRVNCVLDVGGHHGEYARLLREVAYRGRIVSFEPIAENYLRLSHAMRRDPDWRGMQIALGAERGRQPINVTGATDQSSFLTPSVHSTTWFGSAGVVTRTELVRVERLDEVFRECVAGLDKPRVYLKLDTQGSDWTVIQGAREMLHHVVGLQTEIAVRPLYEGVRLFPESVRPFMDLGFEITGLFGVAREPDMIAQIEFDCVLRRVTGAT